MARKKGSTRLIYSSRGTATNKFGVKFTASEIKQFRNEVQRVNKRSKTYVQQMERIRQSSPNTIDTRIPVEPLFGKKSTSLQRFRNKKEFNEYRARMRLQGSDRYKNWRYEIEKSNFKRAIESVFSREDTRELISKVNKISSEKLHNAFVSRELEHTGYIYYDPERSKYNQINNQLERLLK